MQGIWTALITPFDSKNRLDLDQFKKNLDQQIQAKVSGVIAFGTTGESPTLSIEEKKALITSAIQTLKGTGIRLLAGTGTNDTKQSIELSQWADQQGVDGLILVTPYYNKPTQAGLVAHFLAIANAVQCEIMLYNVPGRTGISIHPETIVQLAQHPRITTLKEATANVTTTSEIFDLLQHKGGHLDVLSGDDLAFLPFLSIGAVGLVSVASNLIPNELVKIYTLFQNGNSKEALRLHRKFFPLFRDLFIESNPVPVKWCMHQLGMGTPYVRPPLVPLEPSSIQKLQATLQQCKLERIS